MFLFTWDRKKKTKQQNTNAGYKAFPLPEDYDGVFKQLGQDVYVPIETGECGTVLVLGDPGTGKTNHYVKSNLMNAHMGSNFMIYTNEIERDEIKRLLPEYDVIELDLRKHPIDYFTLITNEEEATRFANRIYAANRKLLKGSDSFFEVVEKGLMTAAIMDVLKTWGYCDFYKVIEKLTGDDVPIPDTIVNQSPIVYQSAMISCVEMLEQIRPNEIVDVCEILKTIMHQPRVALLVRPPWNANDLYTSICMDMLIYRYYEQLDGLPVPVKVIMDDAARCNYDARLFGVLSRRMRMSIDFIYQTIEQLAKQHPND